MYCREWMNYFIKTMKLSKGEKYRYVEHAVFETEQGQIQQMKDGIYIGDTPCGKFHLFMCNHPKELSIQIKYIKPDMILSWVDDLQINIMEVDILYTYILQSTHSVEKECIPCLYLDFFAYSRYKNQIPKLVVKPYPLCV